MTNQNPARKSLNLTNTFDFEERNFRQKIHYITMLYLAGCEKWSVRATIAKSLPSVWPTQFIRKKMQVSKRKQIIIDNIAEPDSRPVNGTARGNASPCERITWRHWRRITSIWLRNTKSATRYSASPTEKTSRQFPVITIIRSRSQNPTGQNGLFSMSWKVSQAALGHGKS